MLPVLPFDDHDVDELQVVFNPSHEFPAVVRVKHNWRLTGDCDLSYADLTTLRNLHRVLEYALNYIADELNALYQEAIQSDEEENDDSMGDIPF